MGTVYFGGKILTMEQEQDRPEAIYVKKGIIQAVGPLNTVLPQAGKTAHLVDLQGKCLMPGFLDAHSHCVMNGQFSLMADLSGCQSFQDIETVMRDYIAEHHITEQGIAVGVGYDHNFLAEQAQPAKCVLDRVSTTIPIFIIHVSSHLACANSAMLKLAGVDSDTPDPQGGKLGRIPGTMEPDGYVEEGAMQLIQAYMGKRMKVRILNMLDGMQKVYLEHGVTTMQEGAATPSSLKLLKLAQALKKLKADVVVYPMAGEEAQKLFQDHAKMAGKYKKHIKLGGYKIVLDGSPQGRTAWMSQPYLGGEEGYCAYPWLKDEDAYRHTLTAINENRQILAHCNGDAASEQFLRVYEKAYAESSNPSKAQLRPVMVHCQTVREDQLDRMTKLNMIPSIFVGHVYYWGDVHLQNFGPERGHRISPVKDALDRGMPLNFHQDTPITKPNMLHSVWAAVNRISRQGQVIGECQKIKVYDALKAVTIHAAYQYGEEHSKGSIQVGKRADLVILDRCPLDVDPMELKNIQVMETIKDGKTVYRR